MVYIYNRSDNKNLRRELRRNQPSTERLLWAKLRNRQLLGYKFRRQYGIGQYVVDICCPELKLVVEIDGDSHYKSEGVKYRDKVRQAHIEDLEFTVVRFTNLEIVENTQGVLEAIIQHLNLITSPNLSFEKERNTPIQLP